MLIIIGLRRVLRRFLNLFSLKESFAWKYETCKVCGCAFRVQWHVDDLIWKKVMNVKDSSGGSLCVDCFVKKAERQGVYISKSLIKLGLFYPEIGRFSTGADGLRDINNPCSFYSTCRVTLDRACEGDGHPLCKKTCLNYANEFN